MAEKTILIVEDRRDMRLVLTRILKEGKYRVCAAANGKEGMSLFREKKPDMVLLDIDLPDTNGYQVCKEMRSDTSQARVPIIFVTVKSKPEDFIKGLKLGGDGYIFKPYDPDELLKRIEAVFRRSGAA